MTKSLTAIENYLDTLCSQHTLLQHGVDGRKAFYRVTGDESSALTTNAADKALHVANYGGRYTGSAEMMIKPINLTLKVLVKCEGISEAQREAAYVVAEEIMDDIIAKLAFDSANIGDCFPLYGIDFTSLPFDRIGPEGQNGYGYRIVLPIRSEAPNYNPAKWI